MKVAMKKIEVSQLNVRIGTGYPPPYDEPCKARRRWRLGDAAGLTQFGVNLLELEPGQWSSQRHWHTAEDEFAYVLSGEVVLVTGDGEEVLRAGDCAGFKCGDPDGHCLQNRSGAKATILEVGSRKKSEDACHYPDIDLHLFAGAQTYAHKDGTPYGDRDG
jgi:uncharacterized cupin superfamily protein